MTRFVVDIEWISQNKMSRSREYVATEAANADDAANVASVKLIEARGGYTAVKGVQVAPDDGMAKIDESVEVKRGPGRPRKA